MARLLPAFIGILGDLGLARGDIVLFEIRGKGPCIYKPNGCFMDLLGALQSTVGYTGSLVVPTCTASEGYPKPTFDPVLSSSEAGSFSEFFRKQPGVVRSHCPTHSVAALGPAAQEIVGGHRSAVGRPTPWGEGPFGHGSPWDVLAEKNAWWLMLDADWQQSPFTTYVQALHAERCAGIAKHMPFPQFSGRALADVLAHSGVLRQELWLGHRIEVFRLQPALAAALDVLAREPERLRPCEEFRTWLATVERITRQGYLQAGVAKVAITPSTPCLRWDGKQLSGVHRDLYARVLFLSHGSNRLALVLCDLLGMAGGLVDRVREHVHRKSGLPYASIMVACTHAHSTPDTAGAGNEDPGYLETMVEAISEGVCQAVANAQPVRLGWGRVPIRGLAHSRRIRMTDGRVYTTRYGVPSTWRVRPELIAGQGPMDPDLTVIRVESLDGKVLSVVSNFGCHASVALMSPFVSGDYPGEAMHALENVLGESAVALCTTGTAADIDPTLEMPFWGPRNDANASRLGRIFAAQVLECLERVQVTDESKIGIARAEVHIPVRADWIHLVEEEQAKLSQEFAALNAENEVTREILRARCVHTEVQALRLNDLVLVGLPGEVFTTTGLKLKNRIPERKASVVQLANDYVGYILTPEAEQEGGYEAGLHLWTRVRSDAEGMLLDAATALVERLLEDGP